jgi:hypothetical protein
MLLLASLRRAFDGAMIRRLLAILTGRNLKSGSSESLSRRSSMKRRSVLYVQVNIPGRHLGV